MRYFTTGRLAAYERMMQDNGEGYRSRSETDENNRNHDEGIKKPEDREVVKVGDSYAGHKS